VIAALARPARSVRAAAKTAVFFLKVLPMLPSAPVDRVTKRPVVERVSYPTRLDRAEGDLYRPGGGGRAPGIVVCLGVVPFGVDHPQVPRLGEALARAGFAALLYWSPAMRDRRLEPGDADGLALAYEWLVERPYVDAARSGLLGTCVGGAFALVASAEPRIRDRVAFVAAFAPYSSMWTFARDIASSTRESGVERRHWDVDPLTRDVFVQSVTAELEPGERELLRAAFEGLDVAPGDLELSVDGRAVRRLLEASALDEADAAIEGLPTSMRARLTALSPLTVVEEIRAPLIVFGHDRDDGVIPVSESRRLRRALAGRSGVHYTEFALFQHATPRRLSPLRLARELVRFFRYVYPLFRVATV